MGFTFWIKTQLKKVGRKIANKLVEYALEKSKWRHLVDPSERRDDPAHQDTFSRIRRRIVDDFGTTWKQATDLASESIKMDEGDRFDDINEIIKDEGAYD